LRLLPDAPAPLEQNDGVDLFIGATELPAWLTLLDRDVMRPGEEGWVQFRFREPLAVLKGDRFIIRRPSPSITIGGGEVVDPGPPRHRRFRPEVVGALETLATGSPDEIVLQALEGAPREVRALKGGHLAGLADSQVDAALAQLMAEGDVRALGAGDVAAVRPGRFVVAATWWHQFLDRLAAMLNEFHVQQPLRRGIPKEELKSRLKLAPPRLFDDVLATAVGDGAARDDGPTVRVPNFEIRLDPKRRGVADQFLAAVEAAPYAPPSPAEFGLDPETLGALVDLNEVVRVAEGVVYAPDAYAAIERGVLAIIDRDGSVTLAAFRDHFGTSRKFAQATLEYLDQRRITRRVGDERVRYAGAGAASLSRAEGVR